jgi:hypothetical protein
VADLDPNRVGASDSEILDEHFKLGPVGGGGQAEGVLTGRNTGFP